MLTVAILPTKKLDDQTIDQVIGTALKAGLIACSAMTGPFRISFFPKNRIPKGWAKIGLVDKNAQEEACAA